MNTMFLSLDNAVDIAVKNFGADANLARQEFLQKCYVSDRQYAIGYYDGVGEALKSVKQLMNRNCNVKEESE